MTANNYDQAIKYATAIRTGTASTEAILAAATDPASAPAWACQGSTKNLMNTMISEAAARGDVDPNLVSVDSTTARAHGSIIWLRALPPLP